MSHNPNREDELIKNALRNCDIKSQHELNPCNDDNRSSEVLVVAISKLETTTKELEKTKKQLEIAEHAINYAMMRCDNCYGKVCQYCHLSYCITYYKDKEELNK